MRFRLFDITDLQRGLDAITAELQQVELHLEKARTHVKELSKLRSALQDHHRHFTLRLTQGNINNQHIYLHDHLEFFPSDAIGSPNKRDGQGALLALHFEGLPEPVHTDIPSDKKIFRCRSKVGEGDHFGQPRDLLRR